MVPCIQKEHREELKKEEASEMEEYGGCHKKGTVQGGSGEQIVVLVNVGFCGCSEIRIKLVSTRENHPKTMSTQKEETRADLAYCSWESSLNA